MKRMVLIILGVISLMFGIIGVAVPILPTTPLVMLASFCFAYSSPKLYEWLANTKYFGEFIKNYKTGEGVRKIVKIKALLFLYLTLAISSVFIGSNAVKVVLVLVAIGVTIHILLLKTKVEDKKLPSSIK